MNKTYLYLHFIHGKQNSPTNLKCFTFSILIKVFRAIILIIGISTSLQTLWTLKGAIDIQECIKEFNRAVSLFNPFSIIIWILTRQKPASQSSLALMVQHGDCCLVSLEQLTSSGWCCCNTTQTCSINIAKTCGILCSV